MKKKLLFILCLFLFNLNSFSQATSMFCTNPAAEQLMLGNYNPAMYTASTIINFPDSISKGILQRVNSDTLKQYILQLASFKNRNTGSDTLSSIPET